MSNNPISNIDPNGDNPLLIGAAIGFISNGIQNAASGNNFFQGGFKAAAIGAWGGGISSGIGQAFGNVSGFGNELLRAGAHGVSGGLESMAGGGSFGSGFLSGGISSGFGSGIDALGGGATAQWAGGGLSGGIGSVIGGGNFFQGAGIGLMVGGLNHAGNHLFNNDPPWLRKFKEWYKELWGSLGFGEDIPTYKDTKMALKDTEAKAQKIVDGQMMAMSMMFGGNPVSMAGMRGLGRYFASLEHMSSAGKVIAKVVKDAPRLVAEYGGKASDWRKMSSKTYTGKDGFKFSTHWYENIKTGKRVEFKTKFGG